MVGGGAYQFHVSGSYLAHDFGGQSHYQTVGGTTVRGVTTEPAATTLPLPMLAPLSTMARMPISTSWSILAP
jgi:hypothetical protein